MEIPWKSIVTVKKISGVTLDGFVTLQISSQIGLNKFLGNKFDIFSSAKHFLNNVPINVHKSINVPKYIEKKMIFISSLSVRVGCLVAYTCWAAFLARADQMLLSTWISVYW